MQLGITWATKGPEDAWAAEHKPQWNKSGFSPDETAANYGDVGRWAGHVHAAVPDCNCIADLRTVSVQDFLAHPARGKGPVYDWFVDWVAGTVEEAAGAVKHWEIWGEAACPYTGKGFVEADGRKLYEGMTYVDLLQRCYERIKSIDPEAKVLLGGHGCDMFLKFYRQVMEAGGGAHFDVNCLHPFALKWRTWETIEPMLREGFEAMRNICAAQGFERPHPLCITEFAWPTTPGMADWTPEALGSNVLPSVLSVSEEQAADWTEKCFQLFKEEGVEFVVWAGFQEVGGGRSHWGTKLGILRADGTPKGRLYEVVVEAMARGRETGLKR